MTVPDHVAVVGGGTMGAGIVHTFLAAGSGVTLVETDDERVAAGRAAVERSLEGAQQRGKLPEGRHPSDLLDRLGAVTGVEKVDAGTELVVEAVPERLELKRRVLAAAAAACPTAVLASNTSSLSVTALAEDLPRGRVLGMHFFNPVPAQRLVELVVTPDTHDVTTTRVRSWVEELGKTVIVVRDAPGFATSRLGVAVGLEAIRMLEDDVASAEDIDTGMKLGYRWPVGPLELTDIVGLEVRLDIAEHLARELGERFTPPQLLRDKVARGELGRKSGQGFHSWP
jgi:3-hydroxybutyryl-CoA dehydrogenase